MKTYLRRASLASLVLLFAAGFVTAEEIVYVVNSYVHGPSAHTQVLEVRGKTMAVADHMELWGFAGHTAVVTPDGDDLWVTCPPSNVIFRIDTTTFTKVGDHYLGDVPIHAPMGVAFTPDGSEGWVTLSNTGKVLVLNGDTMAYITEFDIGGLPNFILFSPDGSRAFVVDYQNATVKVIRQSDHAILATLSFGGHALQDAVITSTGNRVYVSNMEMNQIEVIRTVDNAILPPIVTDRIKPRGLAISPDDDYLFVGHYLAINAKVDMLRLGDRTVVSTVDIPSNPRRIAIRDNGNRIYVTEHNDDEMYAYNVDYGTETLTEVGLTDCNVIAGFSASPVGIALATVDSPVPALTLDGENAPIFRTQAESVQLCLAMDTKGRTYDCDWWLVMDGPLGRLFWSQSTGWTPTTVTAYQGPLKNVPNFCSPPTPLTTFPVGMYKFYFAVDVQRDGIPQKPLLYWDKGIMHVQ